MMTTESSKHYERERERNDAIAAEKAATHGSYPMQHMMRKHYARVAEALVDEGDVVELGCGTGDFVELHCASAQGRRLVAMDLSPECVSRAGSRVPPNLSDRVVVAAGAAEEADTLVPTVMPGVVCRNVVMRGLVHHVPDPSALFRSCYRLLQPGGRLVILEGNASSTFRSLCLGLADTMGVRHEISEFPHTPPQQIVPMLGDIGFKDVSVRTVPGMFAPFAYVGVGGPRFWAVADGIEAVARRIHSNGFGWWYLMSAERP